MQCLHVLYKLPSDLSVLSEKTVLSFLSPEEENKLADFSPDRLLIIGREVMNNVRDKARLFYIDLVARIGATPCYGKTLRQDLAIPDAGNVWWYHPFTAKNSEGDQTFNRVLQIFTIDHVAKQKGVQEIVLHGGTKELAAVLASGYKLTERDNLDFEFLRPIEGVLSRLKSLYVALRDNIFLKRYVRHLPKKKTDIIFEGFWDWSVEIDKQNSLKDLYFTTLPKRFISNGFECAWLVWFQPKFKPGSENRNRESVLKPAVGHPQLIFLQLFLSIIDILVAYADFRPLFRYLCYSRRKEFRSLFKERHLDFWGLTHRSLVHGFCDHHLPFYKLGEKAHRCAFAFYRPQFAFAFQEFFLWSRAFYEGGKLGSPGTTLCAVQHASYNREKTIGVLDPEREYLGKPDGYTLPTPDLIFAMGELGKDIFRESGFPSKNIFLTGSSKYEHIKINNARSNKKSDRSNLNVILALTLNLELEFEMIQAASLAATGVKGIKLYFRSHPFARMENFLPFKPYRTKLSPTSGSLEKDLEMADMILFTYSTVAEEAFLLGIPVCQWKPTKFNGSVFREFPVIPTYSTVDGLRDFFKAFANDPDSFKPAEDVQKLMLRQCFFKDDGKNAARITGQIMELSKNSPN